MIQRFSSADQALSAIGSVVHRINGSDDLVSPTILMSEKDFNLILPGPLGEEEFALVPSIQRYVCLKSTSSIGLHPEGTIILGHSCGLDGFSMRRVTRLEAEEGVAAFCELKGKPLSPMMDFFQWIKTKNEVMRVINYQNYSTLEFSHPTYEVEFMMRWK